MASDTDSVGSPGSAEAQQNLVARLERLEAKVDAELSMLRACNERASSYYSKLLETRCLDVEQASRQQQEQQKAALEAKCRESEPGPGHEVGLCVNLLPEDLELTHLE